MDDRIAVGPDSVECPDHAPLAGVCLLEDRVRDEKCANIEASGADAVVLGDLGCILNIEGRLRRKGDTQTRVLHIAQVLAGDA